MLFVQWWMTITNSKLLLPSENCSGRENLNWSLKASMKRSTVLVCMVNCVQQWIFLWKWMKLRHSWGSINIPVNVGNNKGKKVNFRRKCRSFLIHDDCIKFVLYINQTEKIWQMSIVLYNKKGEWCKIMIIFALNERANDMT